MPGLAARVALRELRYPLLLWDGECGFCARSVDWALARGAGEAFTFVPYQSVPSPPMTAELAKACARAVHVLHEDGSTVRAGRASMAVLERCRGWGWVARIGRRRPLVWAVEVGYRVVAANRGVLSKVVFRRP